MLRGALKLVLTLAMVSGAAAAVDQPDAPPSIPAEAFPATTYAGHPLPMPTIVVCSDQPSSALDKVAKLADQKFGQDRFKIIDGREGPVVAEATLAYVGHQFSVSENDPCLVRYPKLGAAVAKELAKPPFITGEMLCGPACPPFLDPTKQYPTLSAGSYSYAGEPEHIDIYVSFCSADFCRTEQLLGLFQLELVTDPY